MSTPLISIVVPIYNVEPYFTTCVDSLIAQTYSNIEILLVDDGSPDGCGAISDNYAERDSRIRVFHLPNGGVAKARAWGIKESRGEYVAFVDADDILPENSIATLHQNMSDDVDLVVGTFIKFYKSGKVKQLAGYDETLSQDEWLKILLREPHIESGSPCGRLYRRNLFTESSFPSVRRTQDWLMNLDVATRLRKVRRINVACYSYRAPLGIKKVYKPDLEYIKHFCSIARETLQRNNIYDKYTDYYHLVPLLFLHGSILSKQYIDGQDEWICSLRAALNYELLTTEQLSLVKSLDSTKAQIAYRAAAKRKKMWKKITKLFGCKS